MADSALFVHWDRPVPGHEKAAIEFLAAASKFLGSNKSVESYENVILYQRGDDLNGFILIRGTRQGLMELQESTEWRRLVATAALLLLKFGIVPAFIGAGVEAEIGHLTAAVAAVR